MVEYCFQFLKRTNEHNELVVKILFYYVDEFIYNFHMQKLSFGMYQIIWVKTKSLSPNINCLAVF